MSNKLLEAYDNISVPGVRSVTPVGNQYRLPNGSMSNSNPKFQVYRQQIVGGCDKLKEKCAKHVLLDIYMKVLPFDDGYCAGNKGTMVGDIDNFLADKKTTGLQYLKSAYESTKAPLLEFVIRSIENIGSEYMEGAIQKLKEDTEAGIDVPPTPAPIDGEDVDNQIIDIKKDLEYEDFLDKLKKKTVNKIVADISDLLKDKKDENEMSFSLKTEASSFRVAMDYITEWTMKNAKEVGSQDEMIGLAIRESTLNTFDIIFRQNGSSINEYTSKIRFGKGVLINEKALVDQSVNFNMAEDLLFESSAIIDYGKFDLYNEEYNTLYESAMGYHSEGAVLNKIFDGVKTLIEKIKQFISRIFGPLIAKFKKGQSGAKNREIIANALASVGIRSAVPFKKHKESMPYLKQSDDGKHYFDSAGTIIDIKHVKDVLIPNSFLKGSIPHGDLRDLKFVKGEDVKKISYEDYKSDASIVLDTLMSIEERIQNNKELSDVTKHKSSNAILKLTNIINMSISGLCYLIQTEIDPLTEQALDELKDFNKIHKFLFEIQKESPDNPTIIAQCLARICSKNGWDYGKGSARMFVPDPDNGAYGYKFALNSKGIIDNRREMDIWEKAEHKPLGKYLIPMIDISDNGMMLKTAKAQDIGTINHTDIIKLADTVRKVQDNINVVADVDIKLFGFLRIAINDGNVGKYKGSLVIIDYGNSLYKFNR